MRIRKLPEGTINRIAAGEVIERPASVVKELVENAIDADATQIDVVFRGGGKSLIRVTDNGYGMLPDEMELALERHATSKLADDELIRINTLGFRGEALPSIASVSRMLLTSRVRGEADAYNLPIEAGHKSAISPARLDEGTEIEIRDLFFATPARLKFLKTDRSETSEALDVVRRLSLAHPALGFTFVTEEKRWLDAPPKETTQARITRIMGREFFENAVPVSHVNDDISITGYASLPTYARGQGTMQFAFVNGRPVRDKLISGAIRGAYADVLPPGRYPAVALFITCAPDRVDVNVHPAKTELRFRDSGFVRGLIVSAIRRAIAGAVAKPDSAKSAFTAQAFRPGYTPQYNPPTDHFAEDATKATQKQSRFPARRRCGHPGAPGEMVGDRLRRPLRLLRQVPDVRLAGVECDRAEVGSDLPGEQPQQRRLADAVRPDQHDHFAATQRQRLLHEHRRPGCVPRHLRVHRQLERLPCRQRPIVHADRLGGRLWRGQGLGQDRNYARRSELGAFPPSRGRQHLLRHGPTGVPAHL